MLDAAPDAAGPPCELPPGQLRLVRALYAYQLERGVPPTVRELCAVLGIKSPNGVLCHVKALARKGWLDHGGFEARGIRLAGLAFVPAFCGPDGERLRRAVDGEGGA